MVAATDPRPLGTFGSTFGPAGNPNAARATQEGSQRLTQGRSGNSGRRRRERTGANRVAASAMFRRQGGAYAPRPVAAVQAGGGRQPDRRPRRARRAPGIGYRP